MTCVWDAIRKKLNIKKQPDGLLALVKTNNRLTPNIEWNGAKLDEKTQLENYARIQSITNTTDGYDCSTCDPLLFLISELYSVHIIHHYQGVRVLYTNPKSKKKKPVHVYSNDSHFW